MECLAEQPSRQETERKSFDILASVDMARYDIDTFGAVLPETEARIYDEELSYVVEGMGEESCTDFTLRRGEHGELIYFDRGEWRSYTEMLEGAIEVYELEAIADPRKAFLVTRALDDLPKGVAMQALRPGQSMEWYSPFCYKEAQEFGTAFVDGEGFISERKMGFLYRASCLEDGSVRLLSQTVDNSDEEAFRAAMIAGEQGLGIRHMVAAYDAQLHDKHGKQFHAGIEVDAAFKAPENAWEKLLKEKDLVDHYVLKIKWLAEQSIRMSREELHDEKKLLTFGVWAALKKRIDGEHPSYVTDAPTRDVQTVSVAGHIYAEQAMRYQLLEQEIASSRQEFAAQGKVLIGCGGAITVESEKDLLLADVESVRDSVFRNKSGKEDGDCEFMSKKCPECNKSNVWTKVQKISATRKRITGSCKCAVVRSSV